MVDMAMAVQVGDMAEDQAGVTVMGVPAGDTAVRVGVMEDRAGAMAVLATGGKFKKIIKKTPFRLCREGVIHISGYKKEGKKLECTENIQNFSIESSITKKSQLYLHE
jgi:hypothetical protein